MDAAILANNPVLVALSEAAVLWPGRPIEYVVSLGCGEPKTRVNNPTGVMAWVRARRCRTQRRGERRN